MASALLSATLQHLQTLAGEQGEGSAILQHISTLEVSGRGGDKAGVWPEWSWDEHWMLEEIGWMLEANWCSCG